MTAQPIIRAPSRNRLVPASAIFLKRIKATDLTILTRQLSTMVSSGMTILRALYVLEAQTENELLRDTMGLTDQDLVNRVQKLDLEDGVADGKVTRSGPTTCPRCQRTFSPRHRRCLYCGQEVAAATPFDRA